MPSIGLTGRAIPVGPRMEFAGLDVLRLVACLAVMTYHFTFRGTARDELAGFSVPSIQGLSKYGFLGVHLFFVISGFVIAYSAKGRSPGQFFLARLIRIYPAFLICMLLSFAVVLTFGSPLMFVTWTQLLANTAIAAPAFGQKFVDGAYWSIVCELIFYGWVLIAIQLRLFEAHLTALMLGWIALSFANELVVQSSAVSLLLLTKYSGFFILGVALYQGRFFGWTSAALAVLFSAAALATTQLVADFHYHAVHYATDYSNAAALALVPAMMLAVAGCITFNQGRSRRGVFLAVGGITYPLYLLHQNLGYLALNKVSVGLPPEAVVTMVEGLLIALAWVVWRFAEQPARGWLKACLAKAKTRYTSVARGHIATWSRLLRRRAIEDTAATPPVPAD